MLPIVDTHQHLWDLTKFNLPWTADLPQLNRSFVTSDYLAATADVNVVKAIYMEVDVAPDQQVAEAEHLIALSQSDEHPTVGAVISGRPGTSGFRDYINRFKDSPYIKGIRQVLHAPDVPSDYCLSADFVSDIQFLGESGLRFDICMRPADLLNGAKLADLSPNTQFILDHCGNADPNIVNGSTAPDTSGENPYAHTHEQWMNDMATLGERTNVVCKVSGIVARVQPGWTPDDLAPTINHCLDSFGPDRVVFGGDWPVCTLGASYAEWASALRAVIATRPEAEQRKLLSENAERLYSV